MSGHRGQEPIQNPPILLGKGSFKLRLDSLQLARPGRLPLGSQGSQGGPHDPSIGGIVDPLDQALRLQPIHELRHVGPDAGEPPCQLAQGKWLAGLRQLREDAELGQGEPDRPQGVLEARLDRRGGLEEGEHAELFVARGHGPRVFANKIH